MRRGSRGKTRKAFFEKKERNFALVQKKEAKKFVIFSSSSSFIRPNPPTHSLSLFSIELDQHSDLWSTRDQRHRLSGKIDRRGIRDFFLSFHSIRSTRREKRSRQWVIRSNSSWAFSDSSFENYFYWKTVLTSFLKRDILQLRLSLVFFWGGLFDIEKKTTKEKQRKGEPRG